MGKKTRQRGASAQSSAACSGRTHAPHARAARTRHTHAPPPSLSFLSALPSAPNLLLNRVFTRSSACIPGCAERCSFCISPWLNDLGLAPVQTPKFPH
eukprot:5662601-Pleurochrysis_carterae.AAC.3